MWLVENGVASWSENGFGAQLSLDRPQSGIGAVRIGPLSLGGSHILGVSSDVIGTNASSKWTRYTRGRDLVAHYGTEDSSIEIYWRVGSRRFPADVHGLEMLVSTQTRLLDAYPRITIVSEISCDEVWQLTDERSDQFEKLPLGESLESAAPQPDRPGVFLLRSQQWPISYVQMVYPGDYDPTLTRLIVPTPATLRIEHEVLGDRLEKGVIRRGQLGGAFVPRREDQLVAAAAYRALRWAAPPLTT